MHQPTIIRRQDSACRWHRFLPLMQLSAAPEKFESKRVCSDKRLHEPCTPVHFCCSWSWRPLLCGLSNSTPDEALPTLDTFLKQTTAARSCRRAQTVCAVVQGPRRQTVSDALPFTSSALRKWGHRFANQGVQGLVDRPRRSPPSLLQDRPHLEPEGLRQYIHQVIALLSPTNKEGVIAPTAVASTGRKSSRRH